jgi:hypothetical protein
MMSIMNLPLDWSITSFFSNLQTTIQTIGGAAVSCLGVALIVVAIFKLASALVSHGKKQVSWGVIIALFILGGVCLAGGILLFINVAKGSESTIEGLGNAIMFLRR